MNLLERMIRDGAFALGYNLTDQTSVADVRDLIGKLRPLDCGKELIRIGGAADGGYLIPNDLDGVAYCFSPGVGPTVDFDTHLAILKIRSFLADYSVDSPPIARPEFTFDKKFLGAIDTETSFTLKSWRDKYLAANAHDLLLEMDIEGGEYEVILSTPIAILSDFRIMVIEFHSLEKLFEPFAYSVFKTCFEKILSHFHVVHIHPNNCCGSVRRRGLEVPRIMEFTFYNKNRVTGTKSRKDFPHALDKDNTPRKKPLQLPKCWYS
jgi:methyltransferase FkbM-like protein